MRKLPEFSKLWSNCPNGDTTTTKREIGGNVDADWIDNTCAIRISHALNLSGFKVSGGRGVTTVRGGNGMRYIFRVSELKRFLSRQVGEPDVSETGPDGEIARTAFEGKRGIICFEGPRFAPGTGHFDLWSIDRTAYRTMFFKATAVHLWVCPEQVALREGHERYAQATGPRLAGRVGDTKSG